MKLKSFLTLIVPIILLFSSITYMQSNPYGSRMPNKETKNIQGVQKMFSTSGTVVYVDSLNGANDTTALESRGYLLYWRGTGTPGTTFWFQGNSSVFSAYDGPPTGYVAANYNSVTGANDIDDWLVLPKVAGGVCAGDTLYFYSRSPLGSGYPDSIRVMYSANDSVPEGAWVELGRFKTITDGTWELRGFAAPTTSLNGRFAIRYCVANGGPSGSNSNYIGIDAISIVRSQVLPQYYNSTGGTTANNFPFNQNSGKAINNLIRAGELNQPTSLPSGYQISKIYFLAKDPGDRKFTDLQVLLAQDDITDLTDAQFYPGPYDTVFFSAYDSLKTTGTWFSIPLQHPFPYDPSKSLILFVGQCGASGTGLAIIRNSLTGIRRVWSVGGCPFVPYASSDANVYNFGVDIIPIGDYTPDLLYYKFEENLGGTIVKNCANPGVGNNPATFTNMVIDTNGQFDSCLVGTGISSSGVETGWNCDLG
ncbi:MAG: choice-of-anchor J domain-containing protein, partial [Ignavibacteriales bacterium]|nr:choice-of-anchor J domain-containing protein [Ignavibacteriales bacterium]